MISKLNSNLQMRAKKERCFSEESKSKIIMQHSEAVLRQRTGISAVVLYAGAAPCLTKLRESVLRVIDAANSA
jgi:hypothetical protein